MVSSKSTASLAKFNKRINESGSLTDNQKLLLPKLSMGGQLNETIDNPYINLGWPPLLGAKVPPTPIYFFKTNVDYMDAAFTSGCAMGG